MRGARGCSPPAGQTPKRKETCAAKDRVATEAKRRRKGYVLETQMEKKLGYI